MNDQGVLNNDILKAFCFLVKKAIQKYFLSGRKMVRVPNYIKTYLSTTKWLILIRKNVTSLSYVIFNCWATLNIELKKKKKKLIATKSKLVGIKGYLKTVMWPCFCFLFWIIFAVLNRFWIRPVFTQNFWGGFRALKPKSYDLLPIGAARIFIGGGANHKSHENDVIRNFQDRTFCGAKVS